MKPPGEITWDRSFHHSGIIKKNHRDRIVSYSYVYLLHWPTHLGYGSLPRKLKAVQQEKETIGIIKIKSPHSRYW